MQTMGVFAHEYGHALGLPDLYDTDNSSAGIGDWSLMAGGSWNGVITSGDRPAHLDAWSKFFLGWVTPAPVSGVLTGESILQAATNADVYQLLNGTPTSGEYFLVENRQLAGFDKGLPGDGLLIWHIDGDRISDAMITNTVNNNECYPGGPSCVSGHFGVALAQADDQWDLERGTNRGDSGDPYASPGSTSFTDSTSPNSSLYSGVPSDVNITGISASGAVMTADLAWGTCTDNDGDGYGNPGSAGCPNGSAPDCDDSDPDIYPGGLPIRIPGTPASYFTSLYGAYSAAGELQTVQVQDSVLTEDVNFDIAKTVTLQGGYDCGFSSVTGITSINGAVALSDGTMFMGDIVVQ